MSPVSAGFRRGSLPFTATPPVCVLTADEGWPPSQSYWKHHIIKKIYLMRGSLLHSRDFAGSLWQDTFSALNKCLPGHTLSGSAVSPREDTCLLQKVPCRGDRWPAHQALLWGMCPKSTPSTQPAHSPFERQLSKIRRHSECLVPTGPNCTESPWPLHLPSALHPPAHGRSSGLAPYIQKSLQGQWPLRPQAGRASISHRPFRGQLSLPVWGSLH